MGLASRCQGFDAVFTRILLSLSATFPREIRIFETRFAEILVLSRSLADVLFTCANKQKIYFYIKLNCKLSELLFWFSVETFVLLLNLIWCLFLLEEKGSLFLNCCLASNNYSLSRISLF